MIASGGARRQPFACAVCSLHVHGNPASPAGGILMVNYGKSGLTFLQQFAIWKYMIVFYFSIIFLSIVAMVKMIANIQEFYKRHKNITICFNSISPQLKSDSKSFSRNTDTCVSSLNHWRPCLPYPIHAHKTLVPEVIPSKPKKNLCFHIPSPCHDALPVCTALLIEKIIFSVISLRKENPEKKYREILDQAATRLWDCCRAESKKSFSQRVRRLVEWCDINTAPSVIADPIKKLRKNIAVY